MNIPFNLPYIPRSSFDGIFQVLNSKHLKGDGVKSLSAGKYVSDLTGGGKVLLTPSCTDALAMSSLLIGLEPGDEVIIPSFTFTSAALAIVNFGAIPVFVDIDPITKNIDVDLIRDAITSKTKAISVVNYAGVGCNFEALKSICDEFELYLIEDNAHGLGGKYKEKPLGSFGNTSTQSFHETKNIQCGEGGAIIINSTGKRNRPIFI
jgi:dTDP-4-amino-4,6-dideoxygalactose transaminase